MELEIKMIWGKNEGFLEIFYIWGFGGGRESFRNRRRGRKIKCVWSCWNVFGS